MRDLCPTPPANHIVLVQGRETGECWHAASARLLQDGLHDRRAASAWLFETVFNGLHAFTEAGRDVGHAYELAWARIAAGRREAFHARKDAPGTFHHFSNRWMSFILPVWHRTQNATTATRIDSPPSPRAQCWRLSLRRGAVSN